MKLIFRPAFWLDADRHHLWLSQNVSEVLAERWLEAVLDTICFLRDNPEIGRLRRDLKHPGIRSWLVSGFNRWTIFYGVRNEALVFYRIEGGERNLRGLLIG